MTTGLLHRLPKIVFAMLFVTSAMAQPENGLVAKYTFNKGTPEDEVGDNDAKVVGVSRVKDRFGNKKSAYFLHGSYGSYINLGVSPVLKPSSGTISMWFLISNKKYAGGGFLVNPLIMTKAHGGDDFFEGYSITYELVSERLVAACTESELNQVGLHSTDSISINKWHHAVMAYNDENLWLYVDGVMQNEQQPIKKAFRTKFLETDSVMLGHSANCKNERFLCGIVDDIYIYNRVLDAEEVLELYNAEDPNKTHIYLRWLYLTLAFLATTGLAVWLIIWRYKKNVERQKEKDRINMRLLELETRAIRSQMNPHFIFNALNTLQRFILEDDRKKAQAYLSDFSVLLRKLLESSEMEMITLQEEIDILNAYLKIEKLRFDNVFEYKITSNVPQMEKVFIPFMLLQPFVENAIWHGLLKKKDDRRLTITFIDLDDKRIRCVIEDNGVGRDFKPKEVDPVKKKPLAIDFIKQRLELFEKTTGVTCSFEIKDLKDEQSNPIGTMVDIVLPKLN